MVCCDPLSQGSRSQPTLLDVLGPPHLTPTTASQILQAHHRLSPPVPPPGRHPFLDSLPPSSTPPIQHLLFAQAPASGEFQDYTARYGTLFEDDRLTLRQKLQFAIDPGDPLTGGKKGAEEARQAARKVGIEHLLDVPFVGLSNGQTRRARMAVALIRSPRLLIVEEPFAGLDPEGRKEIAGILGGLRDEGVRVVLVLRGGEDVPEWITHVAEATEDSGLRTGVRGDEKAWWEERKGSAWRDDPAKWTTIGADVGAGKQVVKLQSVDVSYGPKKVRPLLCLVKSLWLTCGCAPRTGIGGHQLGNQDREPLAPSRSQRSVLSFSLCRFFAC